MHGPRSLDSIILAASLLRNGRMLCRGKIYLLIDSISWLIIESLFCGHCVLLFSVGFEFINFIFRLEVEI